MKYFLSNAPASCSHRELVRRSGLRWPVESAIEEAKGKLGLDHYAVRTWRGWHQHMTQTLLAQHFLVRMRLRSKKAPALTLAQAKELLAVVLPRGQLSVHEAQERNYAAYRSHRKQNAETLQTGGLSA